jgi:hypothetical protein
VRFDGLADPIHQRFLAKIGFERCAGDPLEQIDVALGDLNADIIVKRRDVVVGDALVAQP